MLKLIISAKDSRTPCKLGKALLLTLNVVYLELNDCTIVGTPITKSLDMFKMRNKLINIANFSFILILFSERIGLKCQICILQIFSNLTPLFLLLSILPSQKYQEKKDIVNVTRFPQCQSD